MRRRWFVNVICTERETRSLDSFLSNVPHGYKKKLPRLKSKVPLRRSFLEDGWVGGWVGEWVGRWVGGWVSEVNQINERVGKYMGWWWWWWSW